MSISRKIRRIKLRLACKQAKILYKKSKYKVLYGGRSSSKSWEMFQAAVYYAYTYKVDILCIREYQSNIEKSSHKLIWNTIVRLGLEDDFTKTKTAIICKLTGSEFNFKGVNSDPEGVKSWEGFDIAIVEEASSISKLAWENLTPTIRKNGSEIWVLFNPRLPTDPVAKTFLAGSLPPRTLIEKVNYVDNRFCPTDIIEQAEHCRDTDPDLYNYVWMGGFATDLDDQFISLLDVAGSQGRFFTRDENIPITAALDVARMGSDKSALILRRGSEILHMRQWAKTKSDILAEQVLSDCHKFGVAKLVIDGGGLGGSFVDFTRKEAKGSGLSVVEYNSSFAPRGKAKYKNARIECWDEMKQWIKSDGVLPADVELEGQLTSIKYFFNTASQLQLESKEKMKARGIKSPDIADALAMTFFVPQVDSSKVANNFYGSHDSDDRWS